MTTQRIKFFPASPGAIYRQNFSFSWARLKSPTFLIGAGLLGLFVLLLGLIQFATPDLVGTDGYYHIKLAQVMREQGLRPAFPWLPLTVLNAESYVDHHFLYHVLLMPFTFGDLRAGAKWASVILPAFTFLSGWVLLRGQRVPYAALWAVGFLAISEGFLYRMSMPRAQSVSLLVLLVGVHALLTHRFRRLLPLSFLYVWLYDAFPLMGLVVGTYVGARWLLEREFKLAPLFYTGAGLGLGLVLNPYFPDNLIFIYHHLLPKLTHATAVRVGNEWYPYQTWTLVENSGLALLAFVAGTLALGLNKERINVPTATLLFLTVLFGAMLFKSRRFVEYYPAFVWLFCALAWSPIFKSWLKTYDWVGRELPVIMVIGLTLAVAWNVQTTRAEVRESKPYQRYAGAAAWLETRTPPGSRVFQTDWDDFTRLFFYNTHNTYTVGLDPTYLQLYDAELYERWVDITRGRVESPAQAIQATFEADYVLTDLNHKGFLREAKADPQLVEVYRDDEAVIFQVRDRQLAGKEVN